MTFLTLFLPVLALSAPLNDFYHDLEGFRNLSPSLRAEEERVDAVANTRRARAFAFTPSLSAGAGKQWSAFNGTNAPGQSQWTLGAGWNLFRGFGDVHALRAANAAESAEEARLREKNLGVEQKASLLIFRSLYLADALKAQQDLLQLKLEGLRIAKDRYAQGKIPLQEVAKIELDLSQQRNRLRLAELEKTENRIAYRSLFVDELATKDWPLNENSQEGLQGGGGSPLVRRLEFTAQALERTWQSARSGYWPTLDANFQYQKSPLPRTRDEQWSGALALSFPIWNRFETAAAASVAYADFTAADAEAKEGGREEGLRREFLSEKIRVSRENLVEAKNNLAKSERLYEDMQRSFRLGRISTNDLFIEQNRRIETLLSYAQSRLDFHQSLLEACALWGFSARDCLR